MDEKNPALTGLVANLPVDLSRDSIWRIGWVDRMTAAATNTATLGSWERNCGV